MKILIVAPSRKMGGIERALSIIANKWVVQGFNVTYVSCLKSEPFYKLDAAIKVIEPNFKRSGGFVNKIFFYPRLINYIRKQVKKEKPDLIEKAIARKEEILGQRSKAHFDPIVDAAIREKFNIHLPA